MTNPKILLFDIETSPNLAYVWGLGKQYVGYTQLAKEKKITCICYKWLGKDKIYSLKMDMSKHDLMSYDDDSDKEMINNFIEVYNSADNAIGHNALKFDKGTIRARLIKHGCKDLYPIILDDTYLQSTPIYFNCHKLDYLSRYFELGRKADHPYDLWTDIMQGSNKALNDTVRYCKQDVILLEKVYNKLAPYIKLKFNRSIHAEDPNICPSCGSNNLKKDGVLMTSSLGKRQRLHCNDCGKNHTIGANEIKKVSQYPR